MINVYEKVTFMRIFHISLEKKSFSNTKFICNVRKSIKSKNNFILLNIKLFMHFSKKLINIIMSKARYKILE